MGEIDRSVESEARLIARVANGDVDALAELYDRYASSLLGVCVRILHERTIAEDVVHDVFVSLHERAKTFDRSRGPVVAWLMTLTRNLAIDRLRKGARRRKLDKTIHTDGVTHPNEFLDSANVHAALANLPPEQLAIVEAAFFEGLSYGEIAERSGVALGTIKSRAARAFSSLRAALCGSESPVDTYSEKAPRGLS